MQKIEIADIQIQDGETGGKLWKRYTITSDDGATTSTFDRKAASLKVGDIIEADIELKGKYANIKSFTLMEQAPVSSQPEPTKAVSPARGSTDERIAEAVAVKAVVDLLSSKVIDMEHPLARRALEFLDQHLPLLNLPPERGDTKPVTQSHEAVQSKSSPSKPPVSSKGLTSAGSPPIEEIDGGTEGEESSVIDLDWLDETLEIIGYSKGGNKATAKSWLRSQFRLFPALPRQDFFKLSLDQVIAECVPEQVSQFINHISIMRNAKEREEEPS